MNGEFDCHGLLLLVKGIQEDLVTFSHGKPEEVCIYVYVYSFPTIQALDRLPPECAWVYASPQSHILSEIFTMAEIMGY